MRSIAALPLVVLGALLLVMGLGVILYLPPGRDVQNRLMAIGIALLVSGTCAIVAGARFRRPPPGATTETDVGRSTGSADEWGMVKYLACAAIPTLLCIGALALIQSEVVKLDEGVGLVIAILFSTPIFVGGLKIVDIGLGTVATTGIVSLIYFWLFFLPTGKAARLLPANSPRTKLLNVQLVLAMLHCLWGIVFILIVRA